MILKKIVGTGAIAGALGFSAIGLASVANAAPTPQAAPSAVQRAQLTGWGGDHGWEGGAGWGGGHGWGGGGCPRVGWWRRRGWPRFCGRGRPAATSAVSFGPLHLSTRQSWSSGPRS